MKQKQNSKEDTYLYATIHNVESINQIAYQNSIQKEGAMSKRRLQGLMHNIHAC